MTHMMLLDLKQCQRGLTRVSTGRQQHTHSNPSLRPQVYPPPPTTPTRTARQESKAVRSIQTGSLQANLGKEGKKNKTDSLIQQVSCVEFSISNQGLEG